MLAYVHTNNVLQIYTNLSNGPLNKFMQFLFMRSKCFVHYNIQYDKNLCSTNFMRLALDSHNSHE